MAWLGTAIEGDRVSSQFACDRCGEDSEGPGGSTELPPGFERIHGTDLCPDCVAALEAFLKGDGLANEAARSLLRGQCPDCGGRVEPYEPHKQSSLAVSGGRYLRCTSCGELHDV